MLAKINNIQHQRSGNFFLIAGPCAIEGEAMTMEIAEHILTISNQLEIPFILKEAGKQTEAGWILYWYWRYRSIRNFKKSRESL